MPRRNSESERTHRVAHFEVRCRCILAADGTLQRDLPDFAADPKALVALYDAMLRTRVFDNTAIALQRTGRLGTYASSLGQEAVPIGIASAMRANDVLVPSFREHGAQLWRGVTPTELFLAWGGDERGHDFAGPREDFPVSIPVGSHTLHAAGVAMAFRLRGEDRAAVCVLGDGATSKGDFYEAINMAGVWQLPVVFIATNNQWAISTPRADQTAARTLAQKAIAAGFTGEQVDGNDVLAVREAMDEALARARAGDGPTLVEALTYRMSDHTTADDASRYRDPAVLEKHRAEDPLARLRTYLTAAGAMSDADHDRMEKTHTDEMQVAEEEYLAIPPQPPESMFDHLFATLPDALASQRDAAAAGGDSP